MQGNSTPMNGCTQKVLSCIEVGFMSWTTLNSIMTWCMCTMEPPLQDTLWNWWPGLSRYVAKFITGCNACNWTKTFPMQKVGKLTPNKIPDQCCKCWRDSYPTQMSTTKGTNVCLKDLGPQTGNKGGLLPIWIFLGFPQS